MVCECVFVGLMDEMVGAYAGSAVWGEVNWVGRDRFSAALLMFTWN